MSSSEEIRAVFEGDIERMTSQVVSRCGVAALYEGNLPEGSDIPVIPGMRVRRIMPLEDEDISLLARIGAADGGK